MKKRIMSVLLACVMVISVFAVTASAEKRTFTVTFEENNGTERYSIEAEANEVLHELPLPDVTDESKAYVGWFRDEACTRPFKIYEPITEDTIIYAKWKDWMNFSDVTEENEFYEGISYLYYHDIMNGVGDGLFAPDMSLSRAMLVTMLYRAEGEPAFMNDLVFTDCERSSYYEKAVVWAQGKGIVNGVSETEFAPNTNVTREQIAAILYRYAKYVGAEVDVYSENTNVLDFEDIFDASEYAITPIQFAVGIGAIYDNRGEALLCPTADATRAEAAYALMKVLTLQPLEETRLTYAELMGMYQDSVSGRAMLEATFDGITDAVSLEVSWANSAAETVVWNMTASYGEDGKLYYTDGEQTIVTTDENGNQTREMVCQTGSGFFSVYDGSLIWDGAEDENCRTCVFEKLPPEEVTKEDIAARFGFRFEVPEGATDVTFTVIDDKIAEMNFVRNNVYYSYSMKKTDEFENISGVFLDWTVEDDCRVKGIPATAKRRRDDDWTVDLCLWHDETVGVMYALSAESADLDGFDVIAIAEELYK